LQIQFVVFFAELAVISEQPSYCFFFFSSKEKLQPQANCAKTTFMSLVFCHFFAKELAMCISNVFDNINIDGLVLIDLI